MKTLKGWVAAAWLAVAAFAPVTTQAAMTTYTGSLGTLSASASFEIVGSELVVVVTNTSMSDVLVPAGLLTAVFFNLSGSGYTLTPTSAVLTAGSTVIQDTAPNMGKVGGEWAFGTSLGSGSPRNAGISSTGLGLFGAANFGGPNLSGPTGVDGMQYGILSKGDSTATGNNGLLSTEGLIKNSVTFKLGIGGTFSLSNLSNVFFQYGTSLSEPGYACSSTGCGGGGGGGGGGGSAPEPGSVALAGLALLGLAATRRRA